MEICKNQLLNGEGGRMRQSARVGTSLWALESSWNLLKAPFSCQVISVLHIFVLLDIGDHHFVDDRRAGKGENHFNEAITLTWDGRRKIHIASITFYGALTCGQSRFM